jgi:signal transduction histidine kinase
MEQALRAPSDALIVGTPFLSPVVPNGYLIPLGRRLTTADGTVEGVVVASFIPADLRRFFQSVDVGDRRVLWVFHEAGIVIAREPSAANPIGQSAGANALFKSAAPGVGQGVLRGAVEPGGRKQVSAFRRAVALPITIAVSLDREDILAPWRREATAFALSSGLVTAVLAMTLFVLFRQMDAKAAADRALVDARRAEAEHMRAAHRRLAETLEREQATRRDAEAANALKDQFLMTVSHELRTPLTAIAGWARMLVDGMVGDDRKESALLTIERNAQAQTRLIEDLLDVSGMMAGKLRLDIREVDIADFVRNAVEALSPAVASKGIQLEATLDPGAGSIAADPARVQQIVWSLLSNAVKFTPAGGRSRWMSARQPAGIEIRVTDTGLGIPPELLPHVFERFRQASGRKLRPYGGLGLGLAIVQSLAELHGGTVAARSAGRHGGDLHRSAAHDVTDAEPGSAGRATRLSG